MLEVQKNTYVKLITLEVYSKDSFLAKSITLDFLYSFENPCLAILELTNVLNNDRKFAKIGLKCIHGIVQAVEEFSQLLPIVINIKFVEALMEVFTYRIGDTTLPEYTLCMEKILDFIADNINVKLLNHYFSLINIFKYCDLKNDKNKNVFDFYCKSLNKASERLKKKNGEAFDYYYSKIKLQYLENQENSEEYIKEFYSVIKEFVNDNIFIFSNNEQSTANLKAILKKEYRNKTIIEKNDIDEILKCITMQGVIIIDFAEESYTWMLYCLGLILGNNYCKNIYTIFENKERISQKPQLVNLVSRYEITSEQLYNVFR